VYLVLLHHPTASPDPTQRKSAMHLVHTTSIPGEGGELGLYQGGADYFIKIVGGQDLMNTRAHSSEDALGVIACKVLRAKPAARVLIGGAGMGFTLSATLKTLGADAEVVVAEIVPGVVVVEQGRSGIVCGATAGRHSYAGSSGRCDSAPPEGTRWL